MDAQREPGLIGEFLQADLPQPNARAIRAAAVSRDGQLAHVRIACPAHALEPGANGGGRELSGAAGDPSIVEDLKQGKTLGDTTYKVHLDGYNQLDMLTGKAPSNRHEIFYFAEGTLGAVRIDDWKFRLIDQPEGWLAGTIKLDWPILSNLRLDPFERMQFAKGNTGSFSYIPDFYMHEFWRFVFLQQKIGEYAPSFIEFPPMQKGASFNLEAVKAELEERVKAMKGKME